MRNAQRELSKKQMPNLVEPRTKKQKLWNDVIKFLEVKNCKWKSAEVSSYGSNLVQAITNVLWHIDGQHDVFKKQSLPIPSIFTNYNRPDLSKHRKT